MGRGRGAGGRQSAGAPGGGVGVSGARAVVDDTSTTRERTCGSCALCSDYIDMGRSGSVKSGRGVSRRQPQTPKSRLADYNPSLGGGVLISGKYTCSNQIFVHVGGKQRTSR